MMIDKKDFTKYSDEELDIWFNEHIIGWSGHTISAKENYEIVIAEMQRRNARTQMVATNKIVDLTNQLVILTNRLKWLTNVLVILTIVSTLILILKK
jgi:hypothetical protein